MFQRFLKKNIVRVARLYSFDSGVRNIESKRCLSRSLKHLFIVQLHFLERHRSFCRIVQYPFSVCDDRADVDE